MDNIFPFSGITNYELELLLQNDHIKINMLLEENDFTKHARKTIPRELLEGLTCSYEHENGFNTLVQDKNFKISLFHLNIRSLSKNSQCLKLYLESLHYKFDIIALTEIGSNADACSGILARRLRLHICIFKSPKKF